MRQAIKIDRMPAASERPELARALLLLGYPLHPPKQPEKLRTEHFPALRTPSLFIHGIKDEFSTNAELDAALRLIPARTAVEHIPGTGHSLAPGLSGQIARGIRASVASQIVPPYARGAAPD